MIELEQALEAIRTLRKFCKQTTIEDCTNNICPLSRWCESTQDKLPEDWSEHWCKLKQIFCKDATTNGWCKYTVCQKRGEQK